MNQTWKGIKEIKEKAQKLLIRYDLEGRQYYKAPPGYRMIMSGVAISPSTWRNEVDYIGWFVTGGHPGRIVYGTNNPRHETVIGDTEEPVLEFVEI